jgi:hypothetical protein
MPSDDLSTDELMKIAKEARAHRGDIEPTWLGRRWLRYLMSEVEGHGLMDEDLAHLCSLYERLDTRSYLDGPPAKTTDPAFIAELLNWVESLDTAKMEGGVAAVFVCHQLAELWLADFLVLQRFIVDLRLGSFRIVHTPAEGLSVTGLCQQIAMSVDVPSRGKVLGAAKELNASRNRIAHKLLHSTALSDILKECDTFRVALARLRESLAIAREEALEDIKQFAKWSDMFEGEFESTLLFRLEEGGVKHLDRPAFAKREGWVID